MQRECNCAQKAFCLKTPKLPALAPKLCSAHFQVMEVSQVSSFIRTELPDPASASMLELCSTTAKSEGTLIACKGEINLLDTWLAGPFDFHLGDKQQTVANDAWETMLKNACPSGIVPEVDEVAPLA